MIFLRPAESGDSSLHFFAHLSLTVQDHDSARTSTARSKQDSAWRSWTSMTTCSSDAMATVRANGSYAMALMVSTSRRNADGIRE